MPRTKAKFKKNFKIFKKGQVVTIVPTLYDKDTLIVQGYILFKDEKGKFNRISEKDINKLTEEQQKRLLTIPSTIASKGSYKDAYIQTSSRKQYPISCIVPFTCDEMFEKL